MNEFSIQLFSLKSTSVLDIKSNDDIENLVIEFLDNFAKDIDYLDSQKFYSTQAAIFNGTAVDCVRLS